MILIIRRYRARAQALALAMALLVPACSAGGSAGAAPILTTTPVLADLVSSLGVEAESLIPRGVDPHEYEPTARQMAGLLSAELVIAFGLGIEEGLEAALDEARDSGVTVLEIGPLVDPIQLPGGGFDPHVWTDPIRMGDALAAIGAALGADADVESAQRQLADLDAELQTLLQGVENRRLVTDHQTLGYFAARYGFQIAGTLIPGASSLGAPSTRDIAELIEVMRADRIQAIFIEPGGPADIARTVADQLGRQVTVVEVLTGSLGPEGTPEDSYRGMMLALARAIAENLP